MECWNVIKFVTLRPHIFDNLLFKASNAGISLFVHQQQPASIDLCSACGANSVPKDPFLACLCFTAASKYDAFTMRNDYPNALSNVQFFTASYNIT